VRLMDVVFHGMTADRLPQLIHALLLSEGSFIVLKANFNALSRFKLIYIILLLYPFVLLVTNMCFTLKLFPDVGDFDVRDACTEPC
jgi:hypothetical protein